MRRFQPATSSKRGSYVRRSLSRRGDVLPGPEGPASAGVAMTAEERMLGRTLGIATEAARAR